MPLDIVQATGSIAANVSSVTDVPLLTLPVSNAGNPVLIWYSIQVSTTAPGVVLHVTLYVDGAAIPVSERRIDGSMPEVECSSQWFAAVVNTDVAIQVRRSGTGANPGVRERVLTLLDTADGIPGPAGPAGPPGPAGAASAPGLDPATVAMLALLASAIER